MSLLCDLINELAKCNLCCKGDGNLSPIFEVESNSYVNRSRNSRRMFARDVAQYFYDIGDDSIRNSAEFSEIISQIIYDMNASERQQLLRLLIRQSDERMNNNLPVILMPEHLYNLQADAESEDVISADSGPTDSQEEVIVRYLDENPGTTTPAATLSDTTFTGDYIRDDDLSQYLSRPVKIDSGIVWTEGVPLNVNIAVWNVFFTKTQIARKVNNYARLNCNLHVKLIINASPFYYGAGLMSYQPLPDFTPTTINTNVAVNSLGRSILLSQRPNIWFYPQTSMGGELVLPFLYNKTWFDPTSAAEMTALGTLNIASVINLQNANGVAGSGVTVQVYCWATDVKLCGPTVSVQADRLSYPLQAEYTGPISAPASAVASVSRALERVPLIAPYAKATTMVASGVASIAKLFGFTNTPNISNVEAFKNLPFHAFASQEISTPVDKLTLDPKQELSIDSRVAGHDGRDELLISSIVQRESLIQTATWASSHNPGQLLIRANVNPYNVFVTGSAPAIVSAVPMAYIAPMFGFWRGDIIYRIRVICSRFHRGRLLLQWDPNGNVASAAADTNIVHSQIIDITEETDVEFCVPFLGKTPFLEGETRPDQAATYGNLNIVSTGTLGSYNSAKHNGQLSISVLTVQTSPVATSDIQIMVSVRGASNLTFGAPRDLSKNLSMYNLQADTSTDEYSLSSKSPVTDDNTFLVNMGEHITSIRQLLRRVSFHRTAVCLQSNTTSNHAFRQSHARLPLQYGYDPDGINTAVGTVVPGNNFPFNFVNNIPLTWMLPCFVGYRGGMNWHYNVRSPIFVDAIDASRWFGGITVAAYYNVVTSADGTTSAGASDNMFQRNIGSAGMSLINQRTQTGLSVYYPNYSNNRIMSTRLANRTKGTSFDSADVDQCQVTILTPPLSAGVNPKVDYYCSIGTDFNLIFFLNCPNFIIMGAVTPV